MQPVPLCICWSIWYEETHERWWAYLDNWHLYLYNMKQNGDEPQIWSTLWSKGNLFLADRQLCKIDYRAWLQSRDRSWRVYCTECGVSCCIPVSGYSLIGLVDNVDRQLGWGSEAVVLKAHQRVREQINTCRTLLKTIKCTTLVIVEVEDVWQYHFTLIEYKQKI